MGEDTMEYREFECWYMKFSRGNHDLTSDENLQSNNRLLLEMPIEILEIIVKDTTWKDVIALRQVSRNTRAIVDEMKLVYKECTIMIADLATTLTIDGVSETFRTEIADDWKIDLDGRDGKHIERAFHKIHVLMKNPKLHLTKLVVDARLSRKEHENEDHCDSFLGEINFCKYHLRVKIFYAIGDCYETDDIFDCIEPGTLEEIQYKNDDVHYIRELYQWQQAKSLKVDTCEYISGKNIDHFARIDIHDCSLSVKHVIELTNRFIESPTFEKCHLGAKENRRETFSKSDLDAIEKQLGPHVREDSDDQNYRRYTIHEGKKVFKLKIGRKLFEMERIR